MKDLKIISWNVNGIRAVLKKGFLEWLDKEQPDILCLQETKAEKEQLENDVLNHSKYQSFWNSSKKKRGYSGTAIFTRLKPLEVSFGLGIEEFDQEGRTLIAHYPHFTLFNVYFPNGKASEERLNFKMRFYEAFQKRADEEVKKGKKVLMCGDVNTAHHEIDLARPKDNINISGFLPIEREWMDRFEAAGFHDTLRMFNENPELYTWWSMRSGARARNVGWRIDYFYASEKLKDNVKNAFILADVLGSDHCPIGVKLEVPKDKIEASETKDPHGLCGTHESQGSLL